MSPGPEQEPPKPHQEVPDQLSHAVQENLSALLAHRERLRGRESVHEHIASAIAERIGTMQFAYLHAVLVAAWLIWNTVPGTPKFDPYPFVMLAMVASVEAIFLSTFVLVSQARLARISEQRAELDVQIGLLSEREITRVLRLVTSIAARLDISVADDVDDLSRDIDPSEILEQIEQAEEDAETHRNERGRD